MAPMSAPRVPPAISGPSTDRLTLLVCGAAAVVMGMLVMRARPKVAVVLWFLVVCFVPTWIEAKVVVLVPPTTLAAVTILVALTPVLRGRLTVVDGAVGMLFVACLLPSVIGVGSAASLFAVLMRWMVPFLLGRLIVGKVSSDWIYRCAGVLFSGVAVLAIAEFVTKVNPFVSLRTDNVDYRTWSPLQERGGLQRVEGAFGHSIALGASMALVLPLILASTFRARIKVAMVSVILVAEVLTFSRIGIVCSVLALVLFVGFSKRGLTVRERRLAIGALVVGAVAAGPLLLANFQRAGSEASLSAGYRAQLTDLLADINIIGLASNQHRTPTGDIYFGGFQSIDNALILIGLTYGYLALVLAVLLLAALGVTVLRRRGNPPMIALAAQIPAVATVALITQYEMFLWFVVGLALAELGEAHRREGQPGLEGREPTISEADGHNSTARARAEAL